MKEENRKSVCAEKSSNVKRHIESERERLTKRETYRGANIQKETNRGTNIQRKRHTEVQT